MALDIDHMLEVLKTNPKDVSFTNMKANSEPSDAERAAAMAKNAIAKAKKDCCASKGGEKVFHFPAMIENYSAYANLLTPDNLILSIIVIALLPAIFEELLFRGVIFNSFNKKWGPFIAAIVSALIFGIYHMNWIQGINAFILGLSFAYIYYKSDSLFVPIIFPTADILPL